MGKLTRGLRNCLCGALALVFTSVPTLVPAAPGVLATSPLFLSQGVEPNLFFLLDDSASMDDELMIRDSANGLIFLAGGARRYILPSPNNREDLPAFNLFFQTMPSVAAAPEAWRTRNHNFNTLYYNPAVLYLPWPGNAANGTALYTAADPAAALSDPNDPSAGTLNLTADISFQTIANVFITDTVTPAHYYTWTDTDGDGVVDETDAHQLVTIAAGTPEMQNFANWYTYYRKRKYAAKAAMGGVLEGADNIRVGLQAYNAGLIQDATSLAVDRPAVLQSIYQLQIPCSGAGCVGTDTPARSALYTLGQHFLGASTPILSAANGGSCQQNFAINISDGFWNQSPPPVGNADGDGVDAGGAASAFDGPPYADAFADTLADVAMFYYENDLSPTLADLVRGTPGDDATHQHLVTYSVAFGVSGTLDPNTDDPTAAGFSWPEPVAGSATTVDDLWHAAFNGRGEFLSADDPVVLQASLDTAVKQISDESAVAAAVSFNASTLQAGGAIFQVRFLSDGWRGELDSFPITATGVGALNWSAHTLLSQRDLTTDPRTVITHNGAKGVPFTFPADYTNPDVAALPLGELSVGQIADLLVDSPQPVSTTDPDKIAKNQAYGERIVAWLRGDHTNEKDVLNAAGAAAGTEEFRNRGSKILGDGLGSRLGDVVHSSPVYVGKPAAGYPDSIEGSGATQRYSTFVTANTSRAPMVYLGANDGGLHGFDATTGEEKLFYLPGILFSDSPGAGMHLLADPSYVHNYYVDLTPTVADVYLDSEWKTVLVGGLRGGGRGVFVLDITQPVFTEAASGSAAETEPDELVLMEFTHDDLGYSFSRPQIARLNNGKWAAIFGNGYNSTGDANGDGVVDASDGDGGGQAKLFILYLDGSGSVVLDTASGPTSPIDCSNGGSGCNGLSTPALADLNGDGNIDRVYAGDLEGNLWVFNVSDTSSATWGVAYTAGASPAPLFTALDAGGVAQPITVQPALARHQTQRLLATAPNLMVFFGTGQYLSVPDNQSTGTQSFYGVWDSGSGGVLRGNLQPQAISQSTVATGPLAGTDVRTLSDTGVNYAVKRGWYMDINPVTPSRERVVVNPVVLGGLVFFNTFIPSGDICASGGSGWLMLADQLNGGEPDFVALDLTVNNVFDSNDQIGGVNVSGILVQGLPTEARFLVQNGKVKRWVIDSTDNIQIDAVQPELKPPSSRTSWTDIDL